MSTQTTQAVRIHNYGGSEELKLEQVQRPQPQAGEVLVRVLAAGVNPVDWKITEGYLKSFMQVQFPYIPGRDIAGIVEEVGPGVTAFFSVPSSSSAAPRIPASAPSRSPSANASHADTSRRWIST